LEGELSNSVTEGFSEVTSSDEAVTGKLPVIELFGPTVQGEGHLVGVPTHFVRLGGCPYRCVWCDSMHAVDPIQVKKNATWMTPTQIMLALTELNSKNGGLFPKWVTLSGGDPVIWDCNNLLEACAGVFDIAVETEGFMYRPWVVHADFVTVSPKPPSSGMADKLNLAVLKWYVTHLLHNQLAFKVVVFDGKDLEFAAKLRAEFPKSHFYLSVGTPLTSGETNGVNKLYLLEKYRWLVEEALKAPIFTDVRVFPQMHVLAWGAEKGR